MLDNQANLVERQGLFYISNLSDSQKLNIDNRLPVSNCFEKGFSIGRLTPLREQEPEFDCKVTKFL